MPDEDDPDHDLIRGDILWATFMAGGAGVEYYFGYKFSNSDLTCEDFRSRANMWKQSRHALDFFTSNNIPFQDMSNDDDCVLGDDNWCLTDGETFVLYLKLGGFANWQGVSDASYSIKWYDPMNGGALQDGSVTAIIGVPVGFQSIGFSPSLNDAKDWVVLLRCEDCA